jgi:hypothetical protein
MSDELTVRYQALFTDNEATKIKKIAKSEGRSISGLLRQIVRVSLALEDR